MNDAILVFIPICVWCKISF